MMYFQCLAHIATTLVSLAVLFMQRSPNIIAMGKWHKLSGFSITTRAACWIQLLIFGSTMFCKECKTSKFSMSLKGIVTVHYMDLYSFSGAINILANE